MGWWLDVLQSLLLNSVLALLTRRQLLHLGDSRDIPKWSLTESGTFSTISLRRHRRGNLGNLSSIPWRRISKFKGPQWASLTLWSLLQGALPSPYLLWKRGVSPSQNYHLCQQLVQSPIHILCDCPRAAMV